MCRRLRRVCTFRKSLLQPLRRHAERDRADVLVREVGAQRLHEGARTRIAVEPGERVRVHERTTPDDRHRPVDDAGGGLVDERLGGLRLGEDGVRFVQ